MSVVFHEMNHEKFMKEALKEAEEAAKRGDRPIGCVIVHENRIIARGSNRFSTLDSKIAHAEVMAMHQCASFLKKNSYDCVLYTTLEPCIMCLTTIVMANISYVVFGCHDRYFQLDKFIQANPYIEKRIKAYKGGVLADESYQLIETYYPEMAELISTGKKPQGYGRK
jgi:tRNA(adenine34) deaminase